MNKDTVLALAREAGALFSADGSWHKFESQKSFERFANLVAAHEREECAKVCDNTRDDEWTPGTNVECAAAIRSRT